MIDINNTLDLVKLKFYNEWLYTAHIYDEGDSGYHKQLTEQVATAYFDPIKLPKEAAIIDMGCGPGYFLDELKKREYTNYMGVTLSEGDIKICRDKGHLVKEYDLSFLPQKDGFTDESIDFIFLRHALEHSPYPIFTLMEYNRILKQGGSMYIEVPAPDCERKHEFNLNHYSILGITQLVALLERTGFRVLASNELDYTLDIPDANTGEMLKISEKNYCLMVQKARPLDIK